MIVLLGGIAPDHRAWARGKQHCPRPGAFA